jgi:CHAT domain-containing protein
LATLYEQQGRYGAAEPLFKRALSMLDKALGPDHPDVTDTINHLALLYEKQDRYADAAPLVQQVMAGGRALPSVAVPVLMGEQRIKLMPAEKALDDSLEVVQQAADTSASSAVGKLAVRLAAGSDRLAERVRKDQDLTAEAQKLDKAIIAAVSNEPGKRDAAAEQRMRERLAAITRAHNALQKTFAAEFPDYAALLNPLPLNAKDIQALLAGDEALVVIHLGEKNSYVWAITHDVADWSELTVTTDEVAKSVSTLRSVLTFHNARPFDSQASFVLYQKLLAPVEKLLRDKPRLSFVLNDALTSLPLQLLVTRDPASKALRDVDWLVRTHAVTVLPSVASLKVLRGKSSITDATKPLIGFADPVFGRNPQQLKQNPRLAADVTAARGIRGTMADLAELRDALPPLPETAKEVREVAASLKAKSTDIFLGPEATETRVKREKLDQYRIVYFATHGLLAGDVSGFPKLEAEPALVLSLPENPTEFDDGLLSASEVTQLKLNADWVVLSACNTASGETPGAEALSGLARAFFYAGSRSLLVSNWEVDSNSAVALMVDTFQSLAADPMLSHGQALQMSMLAMIDNVQHPEWGDPRYWAPFVVVGEPAKPAK